MPHAQIQQRAWAEKKALMMKPSVSPNSNIKSNTTEDPVEWGQAQTWSLPNYVVCRKDPI